MAVQILGLLGLFVYAFYTIRIWNATVEQAEAQQKPCLTLVTTERGYEDAVLEMDDAIGGKVVAVRNGKVEIRNIGNGPAINVHYEFRPVNPPKNSNVASPSGYLPNILRGETFVMPVSEGVLTNPKYQLVASYESLSARHYQSRITITRSGNDLVLTSFVFRKAP